MKQFGPSSLWTAIAAGVGGVAIIGSPLIAFWVSFFVFGRLDSIGQALQVYSSPFVPLIPAFFAGVVCVGLGIWLARQTGTKVGLALQTLGVTIVTINLLVGWFLSLLIMPRFNMSQVPFDRTAWDQADCLSSRERQRMLVDLREQLLGKTREQVVATIGLPTDGRSSYCLGPEAHVIPVDREFMQPAFNAQGQLTDLRVTGS